MEKDLFDAVSLKGARVHNLKNLSLSIPRQKLVVITGPSGSGKSSLAFDTIYSEGQRRYVESLSSYARQFIQKASKPEVDEITGLSPTISIEQKTTSYNPRSTVGTVTEIYDYLRLLFARVSKAICWNCRNPMEAQSPGRIVEHILLRDEGTKLAILAPIVRGKKGTHQKEFHDLRQRGFVRVRINGEVKELAEPISLEKNKKHNVEVYIDRLWIRGDRKNLAARVSESVELALRLGGGNILLETTEGAKTSDLFLSQHLACHHCDAEVNYPDPEPRSFSFNSPMGACPSCDGLGFLKVKSEEDEDVEETDELSEETFDEEDLGIDETVPCPECLGRRLRKESLGFLGGGKNIAEIGDLAISELDGFFSKLKLTEREKLIAHQILTDLKDRIRFLGEVGVGYLSLSRRAQTLSGGEAQRIRLASQIGSSLVDVIYVLDEPSIGLHARDNQKLISTLKRLRDLGNSVMVVEHDRETMEAADFIVDMGPGAGTQGGHAVAQGTYKEILGDKKSVTGQYLRGDLKIAVPTSRRAPSSDRMIKIEGAKKNNLKSVDVAIPLGGFICVTGVSGSGKSTLIIDTLYPALLHHLYKVETCDLEVKSVKGLDLVDKVVEIDQRPIGRTPRSNPATFTGLFSLIRELYAGLPEAQIRGYKPGRFSFNVAAGRCEACEGAGMKRVQMHFMPDVYVECEQCKGRRYNRETLEIRYKLKSIADVLELTVADALVFFENVPQVRHKLKILNDVGLGYIRLGQSATQLSGGEAQRMKLSRELSRRGTGKTFYILDEPTTGLHFDDIRRLLEMLQILVEQGNTVVVIEHNLDVLKVADHIIDMGPEGGSAGGSIVAQGTPEAVAKVAKSHTGKFLKDYLIP